MKHISIQKLKENPNNPRKINDSKLDLLVKSIKDFPEMLEKRPLVIDDNYMVLGGNMRLKALKKAGIKKVPVIIASGWSEEQKRQFLIKDNVSFGTWDYGILSNDFEMGELEDWGMDIPDFSKESEEGIIQLSEEKEELKPYKKVHVLISFSPEILGVIADHLQKIRNTEGVEYEQGAN